jgi:hypothetical protein
MQDHFIVSDHEIRQRHPPNIPLEDTGLGSDPSSILHQTQNSKGKLAVSVLKVLSRRSLLYGWLLELRSSLLRITAISELQIYSCGLDAGPVFQKDGSGNLQACKQTLACIQDTQRLAQIRPGVSLLECQLFVDGWKKGAEWGLSASGSRGKTSP